MSMMWLLIGGIGLALLVVFTSGRTASPAKKMARSVAILAPPILADKGWLDEDRLALIEAHIASLGETPPKREYLNTYAHLFGTPDQMKSLIRARRNAHKPAERAVLIDTLNLLAEASPGHDAALLASVIDGLRS